MSPEPHQTEPPFNQTSELNDPSVCETERVETLVVAAYVGGVTMRACKPAAACDVAMKSEHASGQDQDPPTSICG